MTGDLVKFIMLPPHVTPVLFVGLLDEGSGISVTVVDLRDFTLSDFGRGTLTQMNFGERAASMEPLSVDLEETVKTLKRLIAKLEDEQVALRQAFTRGG